MWDSLIFPDEESASLSNLGIFHLNIDDAAIFIAKCLWANDGIEMEEIDFYDKFFDDSEIVTEFRKCISEYKNLIINWIDSGKLPAPLLKREIDESIITERTFLDVAVLREFLSERNLEIGGDVFAQYAKEQSKLLEIAVTAIQYGLRTRHNEIDHSTKDHILYLERRIKELQEDIRVIRQSENLIPEKSLHAKERDTLLKLVIGMAVDGYGFVPSATRSPIAREITDALLARGLSIDTDTVRKWLKEASQIIPQDTEGP